MPSPKSSQLSCSDDVASSPKDQLHNIWQRIVALKQANQRFAQQLQDFETDCDIRLRVPEQDFQVVLCAHTLHLSKFLTRKSLPQWQRHVLSDWISGNLNIMSNSMYCPQHLVMAATDAFEESLNVWEPDEPQEFIDIKAMQQEAEALLAGENTDLADDYKLDDFIEDLIQADIIEEGESIEDIWDEFYHHFNEKYDDAFDQDQEQQNADAKQLQDVLKKSSINGIFRKLAKLLHPDREQDPTRKELRHQQMSALLAAREQNDVFTVLAMYEEQTGQSPLTAIAADTSALLPLLIHEEQQIIVQREQLIDTTELRRALYDAFYDEDPKRYEKKLKKHIKQLNAQSEQHKHQIHHITSLVKLRPYLEARYDQMLSRDYYY